MPIYLRTLLLCFTCTSTVMIHGQSIDSLMKRYDNLVPKEKLYIHFDNTIYAPGENIWFQAYLLKGVERSGRSKTLYIDWFDAEGKFISRNTAPIFGSTAWGNFTIPENFNGDRLQARAYTKWMLNFDSAFLFDKTFRIVQGANRPIILQTTTPLTTLRFFPEGGELVENVPTNIAFITQDQNGMPVNIKGFLKDENNNKIIDFSTRHDGMGSCLFTPETGKTYTAEWTDTTGQTHLSILPAVRKEGVVLLINAGNEDPGISIERSGNADERYKKLRVVAQMHQQVLYRAGVDLNKKTKVVFKMNTADFPTGVLQVTVFDAYEQPLAERVLFINKKNYRLDPDLKTDTFNIGKRGNNLWEITIPDTVQASLSLSVTDGNDVYDSSANILSALLLTGELKGYIHHPAYYFSTVNNATPDLDLVMLTHGWRRFRWEDVWQARIPRLTHQPDTSYLSLSGRLINLNNRKFRNDQTLNLFFVTKDSTKQLLITPLLPDGSFKESDLLLFDTAKLYYELNNYFLPESAAILVSNGLLPIDSGRIVTYHQLFPGDTSGFAGIASANAENRRIEQLAKQTTLEPVTVKTRVRSRKEEINKIYAHGLFENNDGYQFITTDDVRASGYSSVFAYLQGKVPGLTINLVPIEAYWHLRPVAFFMDEISVKPETLEAESMSNIAYIKVFRPPFMGVAGGGAGGAIAIYTKNGSEQIRDIKGVPYVLFPGYSPAKEFYSPLHGEKRTDDLTIPDLRRTLLWQPNIQVDNTNRKVRISFFNNDISHSFRVVLEGVADDGKLIHIHRLLK